MKLHDLVKPIDQQSDEELLERLRQIKHNRSVERPAVKKRAADEEIKTKARASRKASSGMDKLLNGLTDEQREALIEQLQKATNGQDEGSAP